jgi:SAM-dependent methyltransferase
LGATSPSTSSASAVPDGGSFRDPDGRVFQLGGDVVRGLTAAGAADWTAFADSGLATRLSEAGDLVETSVAEPAALQELRSLDPDGGWVTALRHEKVPFVSDPYEWTFSMLRDAALLQLRVTREALTANLALKDATPYNVQWRGAKPVFIDVGSFARAQEGEPWLGYRQFCMLFLYPLLLQSYRGIPFQPWLRGSLEGIHPSEARALLRGRTAWRKGVLKHVTLHAKLERSHADGAKDVRRELRDAGFSKDLVAANLNGLEKLVSSLEPPGGATEWSDYGTTCSYSDEDTRAKEEFVRTAVLRQRRSLVWDIGCNDGRYSRIAAEGADYTIALDADRGVVDRLYQALRAEGVTTILPLVGDVADPSPALGWLGRERLPLAERGRPDLVLGLALVHHLLIGRTIPLRSLVEWFADLGGELVVEFPDRHDVMVERLLARKRDGAHPDYDRPSFEKALRTRFSILQTVQLPGGTRTLYHAAPR